MNRMHNDERADPGRGGACAQQFTRKRGHSLRQGGPRRWNSCRRGRSGLRLPARTPGKGARQ